MEEKCICPICGKNNLCMANSGACWCNEVEVPTQLIALVPGSQQGKSCICRQCISKFNTSPDVFAGMKSK